jgi:serine/threonine-protein kinase
VLLVQFLGGRYRLVERLGVGGMSVVWRAYDEVLGRPVAVKVLATKFAADAASRERIRAEAQAAAVLSHPNVTSVYDYGESVNADGSRVPFVVMELVHGPSLSRRLANGPLPWRTALRIGTQVAAALAAAHARGLVHRDIKPANVMLTANGVKVVDFGIAAIAGESPDTNTVLGTPAYLAPERIAGGPVEPASDVYALGVLLFRALTGVLPWRADTITQMISAHQYMQPRRLPPIDGLPDAIADLCLSCLAKSPADRPTSMYLARALAKAVGTAVAVDNAVAGAPGSYVLPEPAPEEPAAAGAAPAGTEPATVRRASPPNGATPDAATPDAAGPDAAAPDRIEAGSEAGDEDAAQDAAEDSDTALVPRIRTPVPRRRLLTGNSRLVLSAGAAAGAMVALGLLVTNWTPFPGTGEDGPAAAAAADNPNAFGGARQTCLVRYVTRNDAHGSFAADLSIGNGGPAALHGWSLEFSFLGDQRIVSVQSAGWSQNGASVVLHDQGSNAYIAAGSAVSVSIAGTYATNDTMPTTFALRGTTCSYVLIGATGETVGAGGPPPDAGGKPVPGWPGSYPQPAVGSTTEPLPGPTGGPPTGLPPPTGQPSPTDPDTGPTRSHPPKPTRTPRPTPRG